MHELDANNGASPVRLMYVEDTQTEKPWIMFIGL